jgi:hypothetical protein
MHDEISPKGTLPTWRGQYKKNINMPFPSTCQPLEGNVQWSSGDTPTNTINAMGLDQIALYCGIYKLER